jgi:hypothetical protein
MKIEHLSPEDDYDQTSNHFNLYCPLNSESTKELQRRKTYSDGKQTKYEPLPPRVLLEFGSTDEVCRRVFVSNLPMYMTDHDMFGLFAPFGPIEAVHQVRAENNWRKPYGFVLFFHKASAEMATSKAKVKLGKRKIYITAFDKSKFSSEHRTSSEQELESRQTPQPRQTPNHSGRSPVSLPVSSVNNPSLLIKLTAKDLSGSQFGPLVSLNAERDPASLDFKVLIFQKPTFSSYHISRQQLFGKYHDERNLRFKKLRRRLFKKPQVTSIESILAISQSAPADQDRA